MSTNYIVRNGVIAALGISGLMLSACAGSHGSRYASIYDYESGGSNCGTVGCGTSTAPVGVYGYEGGSCSGNPCAAPIPTPAPVYVPPAPVYVPPAPVHVPAPVHTNCGQVVNTGCGGSTYSSGTTYTDGSTHTGGSTYGGSTTADCPSGTTLQPDGTCLQHGGSSYIGSGSSYGGSSYSGGSSYVGTTTSSYSGPVNCPAGTTLQPDNTCMQSGGSSYSSHTTTTSTYTPPSCPASTIMQGDGSCASVDTSYTGYSSSHGYTSTDYLPIRK